MAIESLEQGFRQLMSQNREALEADYAVAQGVTHNDLSLEILLRRKLIANLHTANIMESVEASVRKGGGLGECSEQFVMRTGLAGWS